MRNEEEQKKLAEDAEKIMIKKYKLLPGWGLDCKIPYSKFDLTDDKQLLVCFNWRNLKPVQRLKKV